MKFQELKILNLYCGIGGNRKLWDNENITAVEMNPEIARCYQDHFPKDKVVVGDAHKYLLDHFKDFDFIWSSPPCPSHSKLNTFAVPSGIKKLEYPNMMLYEEILLLKHWFKGKYVVENVVPYYQPLIKAQLIERHYFWSNFDIPTFINEHKKLSHKQSEAGYLQKFLGYDLSGYKLDNKRQVLRNCVLPNLGLHIANSAYRFVEPDNEQLTLF